MIRQNAYFREIRSVKSDRADGWRRDVTGFQTCSTFPNVLRFMRQYLTVLLIRVFIQVIIYFYQDVSRERYIRKKRAIYCDEKCVKCSREQQVQYSRSRCTKLTGEICENFLFYRVRFRRCRHNKKNRPSVRHEDRAEREMPNRCRLSFSLQRVGE